MPRAGSFLVYGATGYTGKLITEAAIRRGLTPVLGGRDDEKLRRCAAPFGLEHRTAGLAAPSELVRLLDGVTVALNAAGPFAATAAPFLEACLRAGVHYLDMSGEVDAIEAIAARHRDLRASRIMAMPGIGFDVVPSDCLSAYLGERLPSARRLRLGISGLRTMTRGSARTLLDELGRGTRRRRGGRIESVPPGSVERCFDFGAGPVACLLVSWGDVASAYYTTGIPDVEVYFEATPVLRAVVTMNRIHGAALAAAPLRGGSDLALGFLPEGPTPEERATGAATIVGEVEDDAGRRVVARLDVPEVYRFTGLSAAMIAQRVVEGAVEPGFQTPARLFGPDLVLELPDVTRTDVRLP